MGIRKSERVAALFAQIGGAHGRVVQQLLGRAVERRVFPARPFDPPVNVLDIQCAQNELNWAPTMAFEEGVAMSMQWLRTVS